MQKMLLLFVLLAPVVKGKSQDSKNALTHMNDYVRNIDRLLPQIYTNIRSGWYTEAAHNATNIKANLELMETKLDYLPDVYYTNISSLLNVYKLDAKELEKIGFARLFRGKNQMMGNTYNILRQRQKKLRYLLDADYNDLLQKEEQNRVSLNKNEQQPVQQPGNPVQRPSPLPQTKKVQAPASQPADHIQHQQTHPADNINKEADTVVAEENVTVSSKQEEQDQPVEADQQNQPETGQGAGPITAADTAIVSPAIAESTIIVVDGNTDAAQETKTYKISDAANEALLASINSLNGQIQQWIDSIHLAMQKNNFTTVGACAKNIVYASLQISDKALLLKSSQKEILYMLSTGVKNLADSLRKLSQSGKDAADEMQENLDQLEIKSNSLSIGIGTV